MKKALFIVPLALLLLSTVALADAVSVTSQTTFSSPSGPTIQSADWVGFQGPQIITFTVAGKTCNLNGSGLGSVPTGCNYAITVAPDGSISGVLTAGNSVCTQSSDIASSCH